ncbi:MAG TPA: sugar phosphate isomerase/epimerase [Bryobacteraceae bacterium]|nr:sugar phosphate isomerase/epimerase [Bryobacteraceae bacterium]
MQTISRRIFLRSGGGAIAAARALELGADPLGLPLGCQTYPVRKAIGKDFPGTLAQLRGIGFQRIEMCSPSGYATAGFGPLANQKPSELRQTIHDQGLGCESCHFGFRELKENLDDRITFAKELGLKQMVLASFGLRKDAAMGDWMRAADELNKIGERIQKAGFQLGYHNHDSEFHLINGVLVYDKLMSEFDPKLVKMQFQVSVISLGYDAATFMTKYPGRFISLHLQDWSNTEKKIVPIGRGSVDWKKLFTAAKKGGVRNYFVEMSLDDMKASVPYLHHLKV